MRAQSLKSAHALTTLVGLGWNPYGVVGTFVLVGAMALAMLVYRAGPLRTSNRRLALLLALEGTAVGFSLGMTPFATSMEFAWMFVRVSMSAAILLPAAYALFLATLNTGIVQPLNRRPVVYGIIAASLLAEALWFLRPEWFIQELYQSNYVGVDQPWWWARPSAGLDLAAIGVGVFGVVGLVLAFAAHRASPRGSKTRERMWMYLQAFGVRDACYAIILLAAYPASRAAPGGLWDAVVGQGISVVTLIFLMLVSYGLLKNQLLDIELKVKFGIQRTVLLGMLAFVALIALQVAQAYLTQTHGWLVGGIVVGIFLVATYPLHRASLMASELIFPQARFTPEYVAARRFDIYRDAVEVALLSNNGLSRGGRDALERVRLKHSISEQDARLIEDDVLRQFGSGSAQSNWRIGPPPLLIA